MASWGVGVRAAVVAAPVACAECGLLCKSKQALAVHAYKMHGRMPENFGSKTRVFNHLYKSRRCKSLYLLSVPVLDECECRNMWQEEKHLHRRLRKQGWAHHKAEMPVIRLQGPLPECSYAVGIQHGPLLQGRSEV
eukprot:5256339-Karenia_brevis.AAC.1